MLHCCLPAGLRFRARRVRSPLSLLRTLAVLLAVVCAPSRASTAEGPLPPVEPAVDLVPKLSGRIELEASQLDGVMNTQRLAAGERPGGISGDFYNRRTWILLSGKVARDWAYQVQFDYRDLNDRTGVNDLSVHYVGFGEGLRLSVGKMKEPFTFGDYSSSKYRTFGELSLSTATWDTGRNYGLQLSGSGTHWSYAAGLFDNGNDQRNRQLFAFTGRAAYAPINDSEVLLHVGGAHSYRDSSAGAWTQGLGIAAGDSLSYSFPTATVQRLFTLELLVRVGPLHLQTEYITVHSEARGPAANSDGDGYYAQAGWFVTGERRPYRAGLWQGIEPLNPWGAYELALRWEMIDVQGAGLSVVNGTTPLLSGDTRTDSLRFAANCYFNANVRVGLNLVRTELDRSLNGEDHAYGAALRLWLHF